MKKKVAALAMALALSLGLTVPALVAEEKGPEITWLSVPGQPFSYNQKLNWLSVVDTSSYDGGVFDQSTGEKIEYYYAVFDFSDGLALVVKEDADGNEKFGFIDQAGQVVVPLEYDDARSFSDGLAYVTKRDADGNFKYGFIDQTGQVVIPLEYDNASSFSNGLAVVAKRDADGNRKYGFIDQAGQVVIPLEYDGAISFSDGLAAVRINEKWGYIDTTGQVVIPLEYDQVGMFSDGLAATLTYTDFKLGFIDKTGQLIIPAEYHGWDVWGASFSKGLASVSDETGKYGFIDTSGETVISFEYDYASSFSGGLASVAKNDQDGYKKYGFINKNGQTVVPLQYDEVGFITSNFTMDGATECAPICYVKKGTSYGIFENPYWTPEDGSDVSGSFPVVPVAVGAVVVIAVVLAVLLLKRKKAVPAEVNAAVQTVMEGAQKLQTQGKAAAQTQVEKLPPEIRGIPCDCGVVNDPRAKFCAGCGKPVLAPGRCPSCGHQNKAGAKFCQECGKPLDSGEG